MKDIESVNLGGKANSLIRLQKLGLPVPEFFVLSASYFEEFVKYNGIFEKIKNLLVNKQYELIKEEVIKADFSESMKNEIYLKAKEINSETFSVRSSANNEDGKVKSFAGQYETFLNVSLNNLLGSIKKCWLSVLQDNVVSYMDEDINLYSVNVIIQKMINPEFAGVAFSVDPTSKSRNYSIIEVCEGVGEKLVSGEVTPTRIAVQRNILEIDLKFGDINIPYEKIIELEKFILLIEKAYKTPIDMEWCLFNNNIYILQARPITAHQDAIIPFKKAISREKELFEIEIYYQGEYFGIKELTRRILLL